MTRHRLAVLVAAVALPVLLAAAACSQGSRADYPVKPVPFTEVAFDDAFWAPRLALNRTVTIPHNLAKCEETGRIKNFELAAEALAGAEGLKFCSSYPFDDSDVFKVIEAAAYALSTRADPELEAALDALIAKIGAAQEKDGYIYTVRTIGGPPPVDWMGGARWSNLSMSHELYNPGHLFEAAAAHHQATGKRTLLDIALKAADLIEREFGPGKRNDPPGHEEIEIGLAKLYRVTGKSRYLDLAKFFIDARGRGEGRQLYGEYSQDHKPLVDQTEAVGHAVRAGYLYAAAADVAALTGDRSYLGPLEKIWENVVSTKIYLTGGIGAAGSWEGYGPDYRLPNASAYAETCANIATFLWNSRMFRLTEDAKYVDVMERILYNGVLSGISLSGDRFFYANPLASFGQHERVAWFGCACCPPNVARILASVPDYAYGVADGKVYVNLFVQGTADVEAGPADLIVTQTTDYPWSGEVKIALEPAGSADFTLLVRIPGWALDRPLPGDLYRYTDESPGSPVVKVNGEPVALNLEKGYLPIARRWQAGDIVEISLPMAPRRVLAHDAVEADRGRVAIERGPLVYCAEGADNDGRVHHLILPEDAALATEFRPDLLNGIAVVTAQAEALVEKNGRTVSEARGITLIPYYAWANRGPGEMAVWLAREPGKARPLVPPGLSAQASVSASEGAQRLKGVNDQYQPEGSDDAVGYMHWWPKTNTTAWIDYAFESPVRVSEASVYWFDDTGGGNCRVPTSWTLLFKSGDDWLPVNAAGEYGLAKDAWNTVRFAPVRSTGLRLEVRLPEKFSAGVHEWKIR